jgi:hypothetical protein
MGISFLVFHMQERFLATPAIFIDSAELYDAQQVQDKKEDGNSDQRMDPTTCPRETWTDVRA